MTDNQALQAQLELLQKLHAQGVLDETQYRAQCTALTGSGAINTGSGNALGAGAIQVRDVGGDVGSKEVVNDQRGQYVDTQTNITGDLIRQVSKPEASPEALRNAYLYRLWQQTHNLPMAGVDLKSAGEMDGSKLQLASVYTALLTRQTEAIDQMREKEEHLITAVEMLNREKYLVLLGDPGGGKSTFISFVTLCMVGEWRADTSANLEALTSHLPTDKDKRAQPWDHGALLPVRVVLRDFVARGLPQSTEKVNGHTLWTFIAGELGHAEYAPHFKKRLLEHGGLILLDGLDEVPEAKQRREQVKTAVQGFVNNFPKCRFLITSRTYAYQQQDWKLDGFAEVVLAPFTTWQVVNFVERWYAHIGTLRGWADEQTQGQAVLLKTAIKRSARLAELAARPLLLTLMASLHAWRGGSLPERRQELYAEAVDLLLEKWEGIKVVHDAAGNIKVQQRSLAEWLKIDRAEVRAALEQLAFEAHRDQPQLTGAADVEHAKLVTLLMDAARNPRANPLELESYLCQRAGLLVERGTGVYAFPHRTFQEYLAACYLTDHGFPGRVAELLRGDPQRWREAALLAGAKASSGSLSNVWHLTEALCTNPVPPEKKPIDEAACWGALLAGQVLLENLGKRLQSVEKWDAPKLKRIRDWQQAIVERGWLPPLERVLAGNALALLGDERDFEKLLEIPTGKFLMGNSDADTPDSEKPLHTVKLAAYKIGKYPVTVHQWRAFVEAWGKKPKDARSLQGISNHPVVYVNWHEANAYCAWLTQVWRAAGKIAGKEIVRLPSEAEWEKAARGTTKRCYPWGDTWDAEKCNVSESGIGGTTPVGMYSDGLSPYGILDMVGNVWEWTCSAYKKYPYIAIDGRENSNAKDHTMMILRGGSFHDDEWVAHCSHRYKDLPSNYRRYYGFRVVVSLASAERNKRDS